MRKGKEYEDLAAEFLQKQGYKIIARNYHCRFGEIDIIATDDNELVFVEVKGGKDEKFGYPAERFTPKKLNRIIGCAFKFMEETNINTHFRIDLIVITPDKIEHFKNVGCD